MWRQWEVTLSISPPQQMPSQLLTKCCAWPYWSTAAHLTWFQGFSRNIVPSLSTESVSCSEFGNLWHMCQRQQSGEFQVILKRANTWPACSWKHPAAVKDCLSGPASPMSKLWCWAPDSSASVVTQLLPLPPSAHGISFWRTVWVEAGEQIQHPTMTWQVCSHAQQHGYPMKAPTPQDGHCRLSSAHWNQGCFVQPLPTHCK